MALKPFVGKYNGVWVNELKNGDISYYINYRDEYGKPTKILVGKKTKLTQIIYFAIGLIVLVIRLLINRRCI